MCSRVRVRQTFWLGPQRVHDLSTAWQAFGPKNAIFFRPTLVWYDERGGGGRKKEWVARVFRNPLRATHRLPTKNGGPIELIGPPVTRLSETNH